MSVSAKKVKAFSKVCIRLKGDGKSYQFRIKSEKEQLFWYIQSFQTSTETEKIALPLNAFYASFRGNKLDVENFSAKKNTRNCDSYRE